MRNRIDIDYTHSRAIVREIGEKLHASLSEGGDLPDGLRRQMDRLREFDEQAPSTAPDLPGNGGCQVTAGQTSPSPVRS